jgi:hypothetical protein
VADILAVLIEYTKVDEQIVRILPHLVDGSLSILQYTDDIILFMNHDLEKAKKHEAGTISIRATFRSQN